jgi:hypothetical protein
MDIKTSTTNVSLEEYNKIEHDLYEQLKANAPNVDLTCPRCGNEIGYEERGNSISVHCLTEGCIFGGIRGL